MDERLRILKMIEEGIITAEQGEELISAMKLDSPASEEVSDTCLLYTSSYPRTVVLHPGPLLSVSVGLFCMKGTFVWSVMCPGLFILFRFPNPLSDTILSISLNP